MRPSSNYARAKRIDALLALAQAEGGGGGGIIPVGTNQQALVWIGNPPHPTLQAKGVEVELNVLNFGAIGDGVTDDTAAFKRMVAAINSSGVSECTVIIPNTGSAYIVSDTIAFDSTLAKPAFGITVKGQGSLSQGIPGQTSEIKFAAARIGGSDAHVTATLTDVVLIDNVPGLLTPQAGGGTAAQVGYIIEFWGDQTNPNNNIRAPIVEIVNDHSCYVRNTNGVIATGIRWILERNLINSRVTTFRMQNMTLSVLGGTYAAALLDWTASQNAGQGVPTALELENVTFLTDNVVIGGKLPIYRWGLKIADWYVPQPGNAAHSTDPDGFNTAQGPSNCDLGVYKKCYFINAEQAGCFMANVLNTNNYAHQFYDCSFTFSPLGVFTMLAGNSASMPQTNGQANFFNCGGGIVYDTVVSFPTSTLRTNFEGGHSETCGSIIRTADPNIQNHTTFMDGHAGYGWAKQFGQWVPQGLGATGFVVEGGGTTTVMNCTWEVGALPLPLWILINADNVVERDCIKQGNQWSSNPLITGIGNGQRPATYQTRVRAPYALFDGATVTFTTTNGLTGEVSALKTVTFHTSDFRDITRAWPWEVAGAWQNDPQGADVQPWFRGDGYLIFMYWGVPFNPHSGDQITFVGGTAAGILGLLSGVLANLPGSNTPPISLNTRASLFSTSACRVNSVGEIGFDKFTSTHYAIPDTWLHENDPTFTAQGAAIALTNRDAGGSATDVPCGNLGGTQLFAAAGTTTVVILPFPEANPDYSISISGIDNATITHPTSQSFVVNVTPAPGAVPFTWTMIRGLDPAVDPVVFPPAGGLTGPVVWMDPVYGVDLLNASRIAPDNDPNSLRPQITDIVERAHGVTYTSLAGHNSMFCIDRNDQPPTSTLQPNFWPFIYAAFETDPAPLDAGAGTILTTDAYTLVLVCGIPFPVNAVHSQPCYMCDFNGLGLVYNVGGFGTRSIAYFGVGTFPDTVVDAVNGRWELVEISKTSGVAPVLRVNGVVRTVTGAPTGFAPTTDRTVGILLDSGVMVAFAAVWATDVSASMAPLRAQLNTRFKLF